MALIPISYILESCFLLHILNTQIPYVQNKRMSTVCFLHNNAILQHNLHYKPDHFHIRGLLEKYPTFFFYANT